MESLSPELFHPLLRPIILQKVFSFLPMSALCQCSRVCATWRTAAKDSAVDAHRTKPCSFMWTAATDANWGKYFSEYRDFVSPVHVRMESALSAFVKDNLFCWPAAAVAVVSGVKGGDAHEGGFRVSWSRLLGLLPRGCCLIGVVSEAIVAADGAPGVTTVFPRRERFPHPAITIMFLPKHPRVKTITLTLPERGQCDVSSEVDKTGAAFVLADHFFLSPHNCSHVSLRRHIYPKVAVAGAIDNSCVVATSQRRPECLTSAARDQHDDFLVALGVFLLGDGVVASSVVLKSARPSESELERALASLNVTGVDERRSCAFMVAHRSYDFWDWETRLLSRDAEQVGLEAAAFRRLFPNALLAGFLAHAAIGEDVNAENVLLSEELVPVQSTVFLLVSYGT